MVSLEYVRRVGDSVWCIGNDGVCRYRRVYSATDLRILDMLGERVEDDFVSWLEDVSSRPARSR